VEEGLDGEAVLPDDALERAEPRVVGGLPARDALELAAKAPEQLQPLGVRALAFIREIVRFAREAVDLADRMAEFEGEKQRGDREVLVVGCRHLLLCKNRLLSNGCAATFTRLAKFEAAADYITIGKSRKWRNW